MTEQPVLPSLSIDRFGELADAYGGAIARWPEAYRLAARPIAAQEPGMQMLAVAAALDRALDGWRVAPATRRLIEDIAATAHLGPSRIASRVRLWWSGIGVATALAGAAAGSAGVMLLTNDDAPVAATTSFGDLGPQDG